MGSRRSPPLPAELLARLGEPEGVFGPNRRYRTASTVVGIGLVALGLAFVVLGVAAQIGRLPGHQFYYFLGLGMMILGALTVKVPRQAPPTWVFVCPWGAARVRGGEWESVEWVGVIRFEDADLAHRGLTIRQCRLVLVGGGEWGFLADNVADFRRLSELLREKLAVQDGKSYGNGGR
jgi:hypothetical protein